MKPEENDQEIYIEKAADILANLVKENRKQLTPADEEAKNFERNLEQVEKFDKSFKENSKQLINWIENRKKNKH